MKKLCMSLNCKNDVELVVTAKVKGGGKAITEVCLKHIRKALNSTQADFILWHCAPVKNGSRK